MPQSLELGCLWDADDERAYAMSGKINLSKLDSETRGSILESLRNGEDVKVVVFQNSYRDQNPKAPAFNILKARGGGSATVATPSRPAPLSSGRGTADETNDIPF
jgi:hypothetical protein